MKQCLVACLGMLALLAPVEPLVAHEVLEGPYKAHVLEVIDGDTLSVRTHIWLGTDVDIKVRLVGVDTPELRSKCAEESRRAQAARDALVALVGSGDVRLYEVQYGKYAGRVVARVRTETGIDLSQSLVAQGHARAYAGGRRQGWCS